MDKIVIGYKYYELIAVNSENSLDLNIYKNS